MYILVKDEGKLINVNLLKIVRVCLETFPRQPNGKFPVIFQELIQRCHFSDTENEFVYITFSFMSLFQNMEQNL